MTQRFVIPGRLPGVNDLLTGSHWAVRGRAKKQGMETVGWCIKAARIRPAQGRVKVYIHCYEQPRGKPRDPDNVKNGAEKIILDALQAQGIIKNDNAVWVADCVKALTIVHSNPRVEVELKEG